jgi:hypothetical protein
MAAEWISVSDRLPSKPGMDVLVCCQQHEAWWMRIGYLEPDETWAGVDVVSVTHWMPLPHPPTESPR